MKIWFKFFVLCTFLSCSTMTKNTHMNGEIILEGGRVDGKTWGDELILKRSSWFKELTMYFDVLYAHVNQDSPFYDWFSDFEKASLKDCVDIIVTSTYAFRPRDISRTMFRGEMEKYGYTSVGLNTFEQNLRMHPDFARFQMGVYSAHAYCRKGVKKSEISIFFPGFKEVSLQDHAILVSYKSNFIYF